MNTSFINQLIDLIASPLGLLVGFSGLIVVLQAQRSRALAWCLFSLCCFCASLSKFQDQFVLEAPALVFPLQQIRDLGRPLTVVFLGLLLLLSLKKRPSWRQKLLADPIKYLAIVQLVIFFKTLLYGDIAFSLLAALIFSAVLIMISYGPASWLVDDKNFKLAVTSIALVGVIFIALNAYQAAINIYPITFVHGRFLGTTGNPQHAAILLASVIPCFMFLFESNSQKVTKLLIAASLALVGIALLMTGSRTGLLMAITTILFFYRNRKKALFRLGMALSAACLIILPLLFQDSALLGADQTDVFSRFLSTENSRAVVWSSLWRSFSQNPLTGAPLNGNRLGFGESSWLAAAANLGIVGLTPLCLFLAACVKHIFHLLAISSQQPWYYLHCSTVVSGVSCLIVGSFFEAFLLGNLSSALLILFLYLSLGQYLTELYRAEQINRLQSKLRCFSLETAIDV